jgi:hypothetical protein
MVLDGKITDEAFYAIYWPLVEIDFVESSISQYAAWCAGSHIGPAQQADNWWSAAP